MNDYGNITVGYGKVDQHELKIIDYVRSLYINERFASCVKLEDGSYCISIENITSTGRNPQNAMWLSEESFVGLLANCLLYLQIKNLDVTELLKKAVKNGSIEYSVSDNLTPLDKS